MNWKFILPIMAISALLIGCDDKTEIKNGELPDELLPLAGKYLGEYRGQINRHEASLTIRLEGKKLIVTGTDPIAPVCKSNIGELVSVTHTKKDDQLILTGARFAFDANLCSDTIIGRALNFEFEANFINVDLIASSSWVWRCDYTNPGYGPYPPPPPGHGTYPPGYGGQRCHREIVYNYITGRLMK